MPDGNEVYAPLTPFGTANPVAPAKDDFHHAWQQP
jgi:hypothetical protein